VEAVSAIADVVTSSPAGIPPKLPGLASRRVRNAVPGEGLELIANVVKVAIRKAGWCSVGGMHDSRLSLCVVLVSSALSCAVDESAVDESRVVQLEATIEAADQTIADLIAKVEALEAQAASVATESEVAALLVRLDAVESLAAASAAKVDVDAIVARMDAWELTDWTGPQGPQGSPGEIQSVAPGETVDVSVSEELSYFPGISSYFKAESFTCGIVHGGICQHAVPSGFTEVIEVRPNGTRHLYESGNYVNGCKDGLWSTFRKDATLEQQKWYVKCVPTPFSKSFKADGTFDACGCDLPGEDNDWVTQVEAECDKPCEAPAQ
jgi:hypothetical protein